ncbi:MAG TPA: DUF6600 domain-containing protein [Verrucomicrobiae bacterium]
MKADSVAVSPGLAEVAKLAQAGVSEEVMLAYVDKYSGSFNVGADQILYLNDLGVSSTVITSMLKHDGNTSADVAAVTSQTPVAANGPATPAYTEATAPTVATAVAPPPTSTEVSYFYDSLSPYGSWIYLSGYGWCWQPTVAVSVSSWRPYSDRGRWYWSDAGWYWNSDYSWGWAAFHYGRWYHHGGCGWVWTPGVTWAPSWVSWRYSDGYCGWAPLPPEAHFVHGSGFSYFGRHVSVGFEFGLTDFHYSFVGINNFCDYSPSRHFVPRTTVRNVYRNTTVVNNYIVGNNNTVINRGVGRETIARVNSTRIREVSVRETSVQNLSSVRGERIVRQGERSVVERPKLPQTPPQVRTARFVTRTDEPNSRNVGRNTTTGSTSGSGQPNTSVRSQNNAGTDTRAANRSRDIQPIPQTRRMESVVGGGPANTPTPSGRGAGETRRQNAQQSANEARAQRSTPNTPSELRSQPQQPQRGNRSLFGDSGAHAVTPQNNASIARTVEPRNEATERRVQSQPNYSAPATRTYPQATAPLRQEQHNQAPTAMSPRGYEQSPRANAPTYTAPVHSGERDRGQGNPPAATYSAPRSESHSEGRQTGGGGGGGGGGRSESRSESRNDSGSGRNDRPGRNH